MVYVSMNQILYTSGIHFSLVVYVSMNEVISDFVYWWNTKS